MSNDLYNEFLNVLTLTFVLCGFGIAFREFSRNLWFRNLGRAIALGAFATWAMFGWHAVEENGELRIQLHQARLGKPVRHSDYAASDIRIQKNGMTIDWKRGVPAGEAFFVGKYQESGDF